MIRAIKTFDTEFEARKFMKEFLDKYSGQFNPYDGRASLIKNGEKWEVHTSRNASAD